MGVINQIPEGFLDLIKAKTGGRPPTQLADTVVPMIDMLPFYLGRKIGAVTQSYASSSIGASDSTIVPENEVWILNSIAYSISRTGVANVVQCQTMVDRLADSIVPADFIQIFSNWQPLTGVNSGNISGIITPGASLPNIVLNPGARIITQTVDQNTSALSVVVRIGIYRLRA